MRVCSRDAAARRRRGVLARAAYAMRKARRGGTVSESSLAPPAFAASPGDTLPEPRGKRRRRRMPRCALPLSRRVYGPAEVRAAIAFFEDFTDGGLFQCGLRLRASLGRAVSRSGPRTRSCARSNCFRRSGA